MRRYVAELLGTGVLVFGGLGTALIAGPHVGFLGISLAFGLALLAMAYAIGPISGCHINPAVTLGLWSARKIRTGDALAYIVAQCIGAIAAAALLIVVLKARHGGYDVTGKGLGANGYGAHSPDAFGLRGALLVEIAATGMLVFTVLAVTDRIAQTAFAGLPIGLVLALTNLVAIPVDNASINPARSLGPAVFVGHWALPQFWVFVVGPCGGALLAVAAYRFLFGGRVPAVGPESAVAARAGA